MIFSDDKITEPNNLKKTTGKKKQLFFIFNQNSIFPFQSKVMMKNLLKNTEILPCRKAHNIKDINPKFE